MADLVTLDEARLFLGTSLPAGIEGATVQQAVSAASRAVRRWCARDFVRATYDEVYSGQGFSEVILRQYPVNAVTRFSTSLTTVLTVANTSAANQRATAALATTGDSDAGLTVTGLTLARVASGVEATATVDFATYTTLSAVAAYVNGLGNGWQATAATGYGSWASVELRGPQGAQGATGPGGGAIFQAYAIDLVNWTLDAPSGRIRLNNQTWDPVFSLMNVGGSPLLSTLPAGWQNVRVVYDAGYDTIPYDVQMATLLTAQDLCVRLRTPRVFQGESAKDYSYTIATPRPSGLPAEAESLLKSWRSYRRN